MTATPSVEDQRGPALLAPPLGAYLVVLAVYVVLGLFTKSVVLNWIVGPLTPLLALYLLPRIFRRRAPTVAG